MPQHALSDSVQLARASAFTEAGASYCNATFRAKVGIAFNSWPTIWWLPLEKLAHRHLNRCCMSFSAHSLPSCEHQTERDIGAHLGRTMQQSRPVVRRCCESMGWEVSRSLCGDEAAALSRQLADLARQRGRCNTRHRDKRIEEPCTGTSKFAGIP